MHALNLTMPFTEIKGSDSNTCKDQIMSCINKSKQNDQI